MEPDAIDRARARLATLKAGGDEAAMTAALERAREQLESFAQTTAELEATLPERVTSALHDSLREEVLPVARHLSEVRGLTAQTVRRLERLQGDVAAERQARVDDLELLVDLVASGWQAVERRLDRLERALDRLERTLEQRPSTSGSVFRLEERRTGPAS
jgi:predicted  nucleic acid-binding Zn-ribbon protein